MIDQLPRSDNKLYTRFVHILCMSIVAKLVPGTQIDHEVISLRIEILPQKGMPFKKKKKKESGRYQT